VVFWIALMGFIAFAAIYLYISLFLWWNVVCRNRPDGWLQICCHNLVSLLIFSVLIICNEFGHLIRHVNLGNRREFAVGMGPVLYRLQERSPSLQSGAFPIGGFCRNERGGRRGFEAGSFTVLLHEANFDPCRGSLMNFLVAILLFFIIYMMVGTIHNHRFTCGRIPAGTPNRNRRYDLQIYGDEINGGRCDDYTETERGKQCLSKSKSRTVRWNVWKSAYYDERRMRICCISLWLNQYFCVVRRSSFCSHVIKLIFSVFIGCFAANSGLMRLRADRCDGRHWRILSEGLIYR
jgi:hypothetical protein